MTYQQARYVAWIKRIVGWAIFIPTLLSTMISIFNFLQQYVETRQGINAVFFDFVRVVIEMIRYNTTSLDIFWYNSPLPALAAGMSAGNIGFFIIYWLIFVGLALNASGARMMRQVRHIREGLEDRLILEQIKGDEGQSRQALEKKLQLPHHSIFLQFFSLYVLPLLLAGVGYFLLRLLGMY